LGVVVGTLILRSLTAGIANQGAAVYIESLAIGVILLLVLLVEFFTESPQKQEWSARRAFDKQLSQLASKKTYEETGKA
jgi:ribose/xylose/arabinose/galactoside ABC-type transport system permease subunit